MVSFVPLYHQKAIIDKHLRANPDAFHQYMMQKTHSFGPLQVDKADKPRLQTTAFRQKKIKKTPHEAGCVKSQEPEAQGKGRTIQKYQMRDSNGSYDAQLFKFPLLA